MRRRSNRKWRTRHFLARVRLHIMLFFVVVLIGNMEKDFIKADSDNLPCVDSEMVNEYDNMNHFFNEFVIN
jgi:hypothetical protein